MHELKAKDIFSVRMGSHSGAQDGLYLLDYYRPIIGLKPIAVYLALRELEKEKDFSYSSFVETNQITLGEFLAAVEALEATGLVRTFLRREGTLTYVIHVVFAPCRPDAFFSNVLLAGTLQRHLGRKEAEALAQKYALLPLPKPEEMTEETASFRDYFKPDFTTFRYEDLTLLNGDSAPRAKFYLGFDGATFLKAVNERDARLSASSFSKEELVQIARISTLYYYSEDVMADFVSAHYLFDRPFGSRVDTNALLKAADGNVPFRYLHDGNGPKAKDNVDPSKAFGRLIKEMDRDSIAQYLTRIQRGNKPASSDLNLALSLHEDMGLTVPATNALLHYILVLKQKPLSRAYAEKLAASLVRADCKTPADVLDYLGRSSQKGGHKPMSKPVQEKVVEAVKEEPKPLAEEEEVLADADYEALFDDIGGQDDE